MKTVCEIDKCAGCMACVDICPRNAIAIVDDMENINAQIDKSKCIDCKACYNVCQKNHPATLRRPVEWYQGWAEESIRGGSSSGGYATAIMKSFIDLGGIVASCRLVNGEYRFLLIDTTDGFDGVSGSKYVKSNPVGIYNKIKKELKKGRKVLFLGLPCQVSSMRNFIGDNDCLYTIDLICHGSPSIKLLNLCLKGYGIDINSVNEILFRRNDRFNLEPNLKKIVPEGIQDRWMMAFLNGVCHTENCYFCHYAQINRVSDLTLGDSWGSELIDEAPRGISLALVQTEKGKELINMPKLTKLPVDLEKAMIPNTQLREPSKKPDGRAKFFEDIRRGRSFKKAMMEVYCKRIIKDDIKLVLDKIGLRKLGGTEDYQIRIQNK